LQPSAWYDVIIHFIVAVAIIATFTAVDFIPHLNPARYSCGDKHVTIAVTPTPTTTVPVVVVHGLASSPIAWLCTGFGRLLTSIAFLPIAYMLLNPWTCATHTTSSSTGSTEDHFFTPECATQLTCFQPAHWFFITLSAVLLCGGYFAATFATIPHSFSLGFGLPLLPAITIPIRAIMAWSARILVNFSVCASLLTSLLCNVALLGVLIACTSAGARVAASPVVTFIVYAVNVWCVVVPCIAVALYYKYALLDTSAMDSYNIAVIVLLTCFVVLLWALVVLYQYLRGVIASPYWCVCDANWRKLITPAEPAVKMVRTYMN
jgi:hypothetical protein